MQTSVFAATLVGAFGHGLMTLPPSTRIPNANLRMGGNCPDLQCNWFTNIMSIEGPETLPQEFRTVTNGGSPDVFRHNPWRAPGKAKVHGSGCGVAGGSSTPFANGGEAPEGIELGTDGYSGLPPQPPVTYQIGSEIEVAWAISAHHAGGYSYRLCKVSDGVSEECFQRTPMKFAGNSSYFLHWNGTVGLEFPRRLVTQGTWPEGSEWAMIPVPGCKVCEDVRETCGDPLPAIPQGQDGGDYADPWNQQTTICYGNCTGFFLNGPCEPGTEFYEPLAGVSGFGLGALGLDIPEYSIADKVIVPADLEEGEYMLSWRWDCEQSGQIWQNCADIILTHDPAPPVPSPPPAPAPTPPAPLNCKGHTENPTCHVFGKNNTWCQRAGCQLCADNTTWNCDTCCPGCELQEQDGVRMICMPITASIVV